MVVRGILLTCMFLGAWSQPNCFSSSSDPVVSGRRLLASHELEDILTRLGLEAGILADDARADATWSEAVLKAILAVGNVTIEERNTISALMRVQESSRDAIVALRNATEQGFNNTQNTFERLGNIVNSGFSNLADAIRASEMRQSLRSAYTRSIAVYNTERVGLATEAGRRAAEMVLYHSNDGSLTGSPGKEVHTTLISMYAGAGVSELDGRVSGGTDCRPWSSNDTFPPYLLYCLVVSACERTSVWKPSFMNLVGVRGGTFVSSPVNESLCRYVDVRIPVFCKQPGRGAPVQTMSWEPLCQESYRNVGAYLRVHSDYLMSFISRSYKWALKNTTRLQNLAFLDPAYLLAEVEVDGHMVGNVTNNYTLPDSFTSFCSDLAVAAGLQPSQIPAFVSALTNDVTVLSHSGGFYVNFNEDDASSNSLAGGPASMVEFSLTPRGEELFYNKYDLTKNYGNMSACGECTESVCADRTTSLRAANGFWQAWGPTTSKSPFSDKYNDFIMSDIGMDMTPASVVAIRTFEMSGNLFDPTTVDNALISLDADINATKDAMTLLNQSVTVMVSDLVELEVATAVYVAVKNASATFFDETEAMIADKVADMVAIVDEATDPSCTATGGLAGELSVLLTGRDDVFCEPGAVPGGWVPSLVPPGCFEFDSPNFDFRLGCIGKYFGAAVALALGTLLTIGMMYLLQLCPKGCCKGGPHRQLADVRMAYLE